MSLHPMGKWNCTGPGPSGLTETTLYQHVGFKTALVSKRDKRIGLLVALGEGGQCGLGLGYY